MPREELKSRLRRLERGLGKAGARLFNAALRQLSAEGQVEEAGPLVRLPGHAIHFTPAQHAAVERLRQRFGAAPFTPPSVKESQVEAGEDVYAALVDLGELVQVGQEVVFSQSAYEQMTDGIRRLLEERGTITAAEVRDHFSTSRKYALALLEHLDQIGVTQRQGDARRLKQ
jgi:selenocysteine-specific elongation factor